MMQPTTDKQVDLAIAGMSCGHCVGAVKQALAAVPGVTVTQVAIGSASVTIAPGTSIEAVLDAVNDAGYEAKAAQ